MKNGYTLVETIIAIVVASIVISSLIGVFVNLTPKNPVHESLAAAVSLAASKLEVVCNKKFSSISSEAPSAFPGNFSEYNYEVGVHYVDPSNLDVSVDPTQTSYKWISVRVSGGSLTGPVELMSLATDAANR